MPIIPFLRKAEDPFLGRPIASLTPRATQFAENCHPSEVTQPGIPCDITLGAVPARWRNDRDVTLMHDKVRVGEDPSQEPRHQTERWPTAAVREGQTLQRKREDQLHRALNAFVYQSTASSRRVRTRAIRRRRGREVQAWRTLLTCSGTTPTLVGGRGSSSRSTPSSVSGTAGPRWKSRSLRSRFLCRSWRTRVSPGWCSATGRWGVSQIVFCWIWRQPIWSSPWGYLWWQRLGSPTTGSLGISPVVSYLTRRSVLSSHLKLTPVSGSPTPVFGMLVKQESVIRFFYKQARIKKPVKITIFIRQYSFGYSY